MVLNLCNIVVKDKYVSGFDVIVDDGRLCFIVEKFKPFCSSQGNLHSLLP
jgi:hypothetical protein